MALTDKQRAAIKSQLKRNIAKRAATQRTKISASEARTVSSKMNKRPGATKQPFTLKDTSVLSKNERNTLGATSKANAAKEKMIQKNRNFAKGTGKLAVKDRVGTKAEYKQLGKDIETRKQLIARGKAARAAQAARAANPAPAKATTLTKAVTQVPAKKNTTSKPKVTKAQIKSVEKQLKALPKAPPMNKSDIAKFEKQIDSLAAKDKASRGTTLTKPKASTAAVKKRTTPNTNPKTSKPKVTETRKLQTLDEAKAKAPKPMLGPKKPTAEEFKTTMSKAPSNAPLKPAGKIAGATGAAKKAVGSTKTAQTIKAASQTTAAKKVAASKPVKLLKGAGKVAKIGLRIGQAVGAAKEVGQVVSGQAEKDFRRIQALENRIAVAKGQKPKYTTTGSNKNLLSSVKTDLGNAANILTVGMVGKTRKDRLAELKTMAAKAEKNKLTKPTVKPTAKPAASAPKPQTGSKPTATTGSNYRVNSGDTLSGIAQRAGVSLSQLRSANPGITDPRKIFRNTKVVIPKGGKVPTGGYTPTKKAK
jgi:LysM repeat protein